MSVDLMRLSRGDEVIFGKTIIRVVRCITTTGKVIFYDDNALYFSDSLWQLAELVNKAAGITENSR